MEAHSVDEIPAGKGWQYEPKWDGFRCLAFRDGDYIVIPRAVTYRIVPKTTDNFFLIAHFVSCL